MYVCRLVDCTANSDRVRVQIQVRVRVRRYRSKNHALPLNDWMMRPTKRFDPLLGGVGGDAALRLAVAAVWLDTGMPILVSFIWLRMFSERWLRVVA